MIDGPSIDRHHWVPKSQGGGDQTPLHKVCHRKLHAVLGEKDLAERYSTAESLLAHPEIAKFARWVRRKHPEWVDWHKRPRRRRR
jgi:hypothetical protein